MSIDEDEDGFAPRAWFKRLTSPPPVVAVLRLSGVIAEGGGAFRGASLSHTALMPAIMRAFAGRRLAAVALQINSPGGSAVQSALIAQHIRRLAERKKVPVYAFVEDVAASGGYWLALAADEIHADANSIVGSIGVIAAGFGLAGLIDKLGVERRVHTAGANKSFLDPFRPERPEDVERLLALQGEMHQRFVAWVKARRGDRLRTPDDAELFSGAFWTGATARDKGLIDGIGDMGEVLRARFGPQVAVRFVNLPRQGWLRRRLGLSGAALAEDVAIMLETRLARGRYGL